MKQKKVPFYANTADDTRCFQASLRIVLKHFLPEREYTWTELDKLTKKHDGYWTWPQTGIINLKKMGFEIIDMDTFDTKKFVEQGEQYLIEKYGKDVAGEQVKHTKDLQEEQEACRKYLTLNIQQRKLPELSDIAKLIDKGFLIDCLVNSTTLNEKTDAYSGHFVVIYDYDKTHLYLHDPGLPPRPERKVSIELFRRAWEFPDAGAKNLTAFRYTS